MRRAVIFFLGLFVTACSISDSSSPEGTRTGNGAAGSTDSLPPPPRPPVDTTALATISGGVATQDSAGLVGVAGAEVWLYRGDPAHPESAIPVASQHAGSSEGYVGGFRFDSLPPGSYFVRADKSDDSSLAPSVSRRLELRGSSIELGVFLPDVARGRSYVRIWPRRMLRDREDFTIAKCGTFYIHMVAGDEHGEMIPDPSTTVAWHSTSPVVALVDTIVDAWGAAIAVHTMSEGDAVISAMNGSVGDSIVAHVIPNSLSCGSP